MRGEHVALACLLRSAAASKRPIYTREEVADMFGGDSGEIPTVCINAGGGGCPAAGWVSQAAATRAAVLALVTRGHEGAGTAGTRLRRGAWQFRTAAVLERVAAVAYLFWRAVRTLTSGWMYFYSVPFFLFEVCLEGGF